MGLSPRTKLRWRCGLDTRFSRLLTADQPLHAFLLQGFWQIDLGSVNVNGRPAVTALSAIVDTGTSLVLGDTRSVNQLYSVIPGAKNASSTIGDGFFTGTIHPFPVERSNNALPVPCNAIPNVSLTFGGNAYAISADTFNLGPVSQGSPDCVGGITAADLGGRF